MLAAIVVGLIGGCRVPQNMDTAAGFQPTQQSMVGEDCDMAEDREVTFGEDLGGYSANSVLNTVSGSHFKSLTWSNGNTTGINLTLRDARTAVYREAVAGNPSDADGACVDHLVITMNLQVVTNDGQINFESPVEVRAYSASISGFTISLDRADILFNPRTWVDGDVDEVTSALGAEWSGNTLRGQITAYGSKNSAEGEASEVSTQTVIVAQF